MRRVCTIHNCSSACNPNTQSRISPSCDMMTVLWQFVPVFRIEPRLCPKLGVTLGMMWRIAADSKAYDPAALNRRAENRLRSTDEIRGARGCSSSLIRRGIRDGSDLFRHSHRQSTRSPAQHDRASRCTCERNSRN
jgi:hypothetical protein